MNRIVAYLGTYVIALLVSLLRDVENHSVLIHSCFNTVQHDCMRLVGRAVGDVRTSHKRFEAI